MLGRVCRTSTLHQKCVLPHTRSAIRSQHYPSSCLICWAFTRCMAQWHTRCDTGSNLFGVSQNNDNRIATKEHLAYESILVDWLRLLLSLPSFWGLQEFSNGKQKGKSLGVGKGYRWRDAMPRHTLCIISHYKPLCQPGKFMREGWRWMGKGKVEWDRQPSLTLQKCHQVHQQSGHVYSTLCENIPGIEGESG